MSSATGWKHAKLAKARGGWTEWQGLRERDGYPLGHLKRDGAGHTGSVVFFANWMSRVYSQSLMKINALYSPFHCMYVVVSRLLRSA